MTDWFFPSVDGVPMCPSRQCCGSGPGRKRLRVHCKSTAARHKQSLARLLGLIRFACFGEVDCNGRGMAEGG